ncbi:MAG: PAS domain-containing protein [Pyrinomonadaceae bacterium]
MREEPNNKRIEIGKILRRYDLWLIALTGLFLFLYPKLWTNLFSAGNFMPHAVCYFWIPELVLLHLVSDSVIGLSYVAISASLIYLLYRVRRNIPFQMVFIAFGVFIIACGLTHFMEVWTTFYANYWLSGYVKMITAVASAATAIILPPLIPKAISMAEEARLSGQRKQDLEERNLKLESEMTERRRIEEELILKDAWLNEAQKLSNVGSWKWNLEKNQIRWSDQLFRIFGFEPQSFEPNLEKLESFIHPDDLDKVKKVQRDLGFGKDVPENDFRIVRKDGKVRIIQAKRKIIFDEDGNPGKVIGTMQDVTEDVESFNLIKRLNSDLRERTHQLELINQEMEAFSYSVSHDLRAPLRALDGFSQALLEDYGKSLDEQGKKYLSYLRQSSQKMGELIDDLLKLSRATRAQLKREEIDLSLLAKNVVRELRAIDGDREAEFVIADDLKVEGDEHLIRIVLENLFSNAWKFSSKNPRARIEFGKELQEGGEAFFLRDNGAGFNMDYEAKLFQPFQRLHDAKDFEGTGIGLALVQRIINRHGGKIWAVGQEGQGAVFYFTI